MFFPRHVYPQILPWNDVLNLKRNFREIQVIAKILFTFNLKNNINKY